MSGKLDGKFHGIIVKNKNQQVVPQDQWMCFLAKDDAVPATLKFYLEECERKGAADAQLQGVRDMINRCNQWRSENPDLCKIPDIEKGEIIT